MLMMNSYSDSTSMTNDSKTEGLSMWRSVITSDAGIDANKQFAQDQINQQNGDKVYARILKVESVHNRSRFNRTETKLLVNIADTECKKNESLPDGNVNHCLLDKKAVSMPIYLSYYNHQVISLISHPRNIFSLYVGAATMWTTSNREDRVREKIISDEMQCWQSETVKLVKIYKWLQTGYEMWVK